MDLFHVVAHGIPRTVLLPRIGPPLVWNCRWARASKAVTANTWDEPMRNALKTMMCMPIAFAVFSGCDRNATRLQSRLDTEPPTRAAVVPMSAEKAEVRFGKARIALGMEKEDVLEQIRLSRSQYTPLSSVDSAELFVKQPSDETVESDTWMLTCPTRNSRFLGGGSGIILDVRFSKGKVVGIKELPWLAG